jgi:hypothetical protein
MPAIINEAGTGSTPHTRRASLITDVSAQETNLWDDAAAAAKPGQTT